MARLGNILDPIHDTLPPDVWDDPGADKPKLKPVHRRWIMEEVRRHCAKFHPHPERWLTLILTGSLTTYQYSTSSDCDVSLFVDPHFLPEWDRATLIGMMIEHFDGTKLPGTPYEMQCFVVAKNIATADLYQPGLRSGYNIITDQWVQPPDRNRVHDVQREYNANYVYALESADKMERLLRYEPQKAISYWHQIHKRRMRDQKAGKGDFSQANIVYKFLANRDLFPKIAEVSGEYIAKYAWIKDDKDRDVMRTEQQAYEKPWTPGKFGKGMIYLEPMGDSYDPEKGYYTDTTHKIKHWETDEIGYPHHIGLRGFAPANKVADIFIAPDGRASIAANLNKDRIENRGYDAMQKAIQAIRDHGFNYVETTEYDPFNPMGSLDQQDWADLWLDDRG